MWSSSEFEGYETGSTVESSDGIQAYQAVDERDGSRTTLLAFRDAATGETNVDAFEIEVTLRRRCEGVPGIEPMLAEGRTSGGVPFLVVPDRAVGTVETMVSSRSISVQEAVALTQAVGSTVAVLNDRGVVVSVVDPAGVSADSRPMLRDLSQARTVDWLGVPMPRSAAPEIVRRQPATPLTDVWAIASFLQQLLWSGSGSSDIGSLSGGSRMPEKLADAITRALAVEPIDRHESVRAFLAAVSAAMEGAPVNPYPIAQAPPPIEQDDDPTVQANEDLIRQIRVASVAPGVPAAEPDVDPTVVANEDLIRQIRTASATPEQVGAQPIVEPEEDPTVVADEELVRQIRTAAASAVAEPTQVDDDETLNADDDLIRSIRESTDASVPTEAGEDATVVAGEDLVRQIRVAGTAAAMPPMDDDETVNADDDLIRSFRESTDASVPTEAGEDATVVAGEDLVRQIRVAGTAAAMPPMDEPPEVVPIAASRGTETGTSDSIPLENSVPPAASEGPPPSIDDLRRRFAPHVQQPTKGGLVPTWVLIAGAGVLGLLLVAILAVVAVG